MRFYIEKEFEHAGLKCVCAATNGGWRCGYVGVNKEHPAYAVDYWDVENISVHGGLTFSHGQDQNFLAGNYWWFGFDCNHFGDGIDKTLLDDTTRKEFGFMAELEGEVRTLEFVESECKSLAEQLAAMKGVNP